MTEVKVATSEIINCWADDPQGPVALHCREKLRSVEGEDPTIIFPPTYAIDGKYVIDELSDGTKVAQVDSVGSQANRMEPLFGEPPYDSLVPQIEIDLSKGKSVSILEAGHRLGDALVRCTDELAEKAADAFEAFAERGDAAAIAKLAPTSLVFGAWDSRGGGAKLPRLVNAVVRAWDVDRIRRAATYIPPIDYSELGVFDEKDKKQRAGSQKLAERGFVHVPSEDEAGGIIVRGAICRDITVNLVALRSLRGENERALRRYVLGLALVAANAPQDGFLRQGCLLTLDPDSPPRWVSVARSGERDALSLTPEIALEYASKAARVFGVGPGGRYTFNKSRAKKDVAKKDA